MRRSRRPLATRPGCVLSALGRAPLRVPSLRRRYPFAAPGTRAPARVEAFRGVALRVEQSEHTFPGRREHPARDDVFAGSPIPLLDGPRFERVLEHLRHVSEQGAVLSHHMVVPAGKHRTELASCIRTGGPTPRRREGARVVRDRQAVKVLVPVLSTVNHHQGSRRGLAQLRGGEPGGARAHVRARRHGEAQAHKGQGASPVGFEDRPELSDELPWRMTIRTQGTRSDEGRGTIK
jgi:hypothetical protein